MQGYLDRVTRDYIEGWAWDPEDPGKPICLSVYDNGVAIGEVTADLARDDLRLSGIGDGRHAFKWIVPGGLSPAITHQIEVRRKADGWRLRGCEKPLPADPKAASAVAVPLEGNLDYCERTLISGWVRDTARPAEPVPLQVLDGDVLIARVLANRHRKDLEEAGFGDGRCAFQVRIPEGLSALDRHVIRVRHEADAREIPGSPYVIEPSDAFDSALEEAVTRAIDALALERDESRVFSFLAAQTDRLLKKRAERESKRASRLGYREYQRGHGEFPKEAPPPGPRALIIDDDVPDAARDAGSQAILSHARSLRALGYSVSFIASQDSSTTEPTLAALGEAGVTLYQSPFYPSVEDVLKWQRDCFDLIYLHRAGNAERYMALARHYNPRARIIYSVADLHHTRIERQAKIEDRPELLHNSRLVQLAEFTSAFKADSVITHSTFEAELLRRSVPAARVYVVPWEVPIMTIETPVEERRGVAFLAGFRHRPNADAAWFLVKNIMPLVWERDPMITCYLAGSHIPDWFKNHPDPRLQVIGAVEYLEEVFEKVRLTVAPLRFGAGIKGKILNSFAAGVPCIMTPIGAEGLPLRSELQSLVGNTPEELASAILNLHADIDALTRLSDLCQDLIRLDYSEAATQSMLKAAIDRS